MTTTLQLQAHSLLPFSRTAGRLSPQQADGVCATLFRSKQLLQSLQQQMVEAQVANYLEGQAVCPECDRPRQRKGQHEMVVRSAFGKLTLQSPRYFHCPCQSHQTKSFSPLACLLKERTSPEYLYLQTKFAALMSYGLTVELLSEVLPLEGEVNVSSVRHHLHQLGQRLDRDLGKEAHMPIEGCPRD